MSVVNDMSTMVTVSELPLLALPLSTETQLLCKAVTSGLTSVSVGAGLPHIDKLCRLVICSGSQVVLDLVCVGG